ncbi:hypothetical protein EV714DRAFT_240483 [Schizophyllum commune]
MFSRRRRGRNWGLPIVLAKCPERRVGKYLPIVSGGQIAGNRRGIRVIGGLDARGESRKRGNTIELLGHAVCDASVMGEHVGGREDGGVLSSPGERAYTASKGPESAKSPSIVPSSAPVPLGDRCDTGSDGREGRCGAERRYLILFSATAEGKILANRRQTR